MGAKQQFPRTRKGVQNIVSLKSGASICPGLFQLITRLTVVLLLASIYFKESAPVDAAWGRNVPVALDVQNPPSDNLYFTVKPYMVAVRQRIQQSWRPNVLSPAYRTKVQFQISHEGQIFAPRLIDSSGNEKFDQRAMSAVLACSPFPPIPIETLLINATFDNRYLTPAELNQNIQRYRLLRQQQSTYQPQQNFNQPQFQQQPARFVEQNYGAEIPISSNRFPNAPPLQAELMDPQSADEPSHSHRTSFDSATNSGGYQPGRGTSDEANKFAFSEPKTKAELIALSSDELENYKHWFNNEWSKESPERRFYFLNDLTYSTAPAKRIVVKGRRAK